MNNHIEASFKIEKWDEEVLNEVKQGPRVSRTSVNQSYSGKIEGQSSIEYLMTTLPDEFTSFIGIEQFTGTVEGRSGSFVLKHEGTHKDGLAQSDFRIIEGSGTGDLSGINGTGHYDATHEDINFSLDYNLD